jgi:hypothetical protein
VDGYAKALWHYSTVFRKLKRCREEGVWSRMLEALMGMGHSKGKLCPEVVAIDSTTVEARKGGGRWWAMMAIGIGRAPRSMWPLRLNPCR